MTTGVSNAVYGCLIGGAVGDSLGASVEGWTHQRIKKEYGTFEEFRQYYMPYSNTEPGTITSDTTLRHYLCLSIVENDGRVSPVDFADVLREHLNTNRVWVNEEIVVKKISAGMDPWEAGRGAIPDNKATSAITPVGIVNAGNPDQAYQDGYDIAAMLQDGPHRHATATVAAGIAEAISPEATIDSTIATMLHQSTGTVHRAIDIGIGMAEAADSSEALVEELYERLLDWRWPPVQWDRRKYETGELMSASTLETLPVAVAFLVFCGGDVNRSIVAGVNYGRDSDAIATITGSIAGALHGAEVIREEWKATVEDRNRDFFEELEGDPDADFRSMADRLVGVLRSERDRAAEREARLATFLDDE